MCLSPQKVQFYHKCPFVIFGRSPPFFTVSILKRLLGYGLSPFEGRAQAVANVGVDRNVCVIKCCVEMKKKKLPLLDFLSQDEEAV